MSLRRAGIVVVALSSSVLAAACGCREERAPLEMCAPATASPTVKLKVTTGGAPCEEPERRTCEVQRDGQTLKLVVVDPVCPPVLPRVCEEVLLLRTLECDPGTLEPGEYQVIAGTETRTMTVAEGGASTCEVAQQ